MLKVALVGAGGWGDTHIDRYLRLEKEGLVSFAGAADVNPVNLERVRALGIACFTSDTELYETVHPDLVSVAAGIPFHPDLQANALAHGVNVLMEKPAAATVPEVEGMIADAANYPDLFALIAFQFIYTPETAALKELIRSEKYGKICAVSVRGAVKRDDSYYQRNRWAGKLHLDNGRAVFDSPLSNAFAHYLNLALFLTDTDVERLENVRLLRARREIENFDSCIFRAVGSNSLSVDVFFSHTVEQPEWPHLTITLERAVIHWHTNEWFVEGGTERMVYADDPQYEMFKSAVLLAETGKVAHHICTLQEAMKHTRCVALAQQFPVQILNENEYIRHGDFYSVPMLKEI